MDAAQVPVKMVGGFYIYHTMKNLKKLKYARQCDECKSGMDEGYYIRNLPEEYYCSDECLHKHYTPKEWKKMYEGNEDEEDSYDNDTDYCYWTTWHDELKEY